MDELVKKLRLLSNTQMTLVQLQGRRVSNQALAYSIAVLLGLLAMILINYAIFGTLSARVGEVYAALIMAGGDALIAVGMVAWAGRQKPGREEALRHAQR